MSNAVDMIDRAVFEGLLKVRGRVMAKMPTGTIIESVLRSSYARLTPAEQLQIVETLGPEWYLKMAVKIERQLARIDSE